MDARRIPFTEEDERRIASAATWGIIVAASSIITALLSLAVQAQALSDLSPGLSNLGGGLGGGFGRGFVGGIFSVSIIQAVVTVLINVWLLQASLSFRKVALTDEADQAHLLAGFRRLRGYFMVQVVLLLLALGLVLFGVIIAASR